MGDYTTKDGPGVTTEATTTIPATTTTRTEEVTTTTTTEEVTTTATTTEQATTETPPTTTTTTSGELVANNQARCGVSELDAREKCGTTCAHNGNCLPGQYCWGTHS